MACRTYTISGLTGNAGAGNLQYWGGLGMPFWYWGLSYWGAYWAIPTERTFTISAEDRTYTVTVLTYTSVNPLAIYGTATYGGVTYGVNETPAERTYTIPECED